MCEAEHDPWCRLFDSHAAGHAHDFCERHQIGWCRLCEGRCPDCRRDAALGEPDDEDDGEELDGL